MVRLGIVGVGGIARHHLNTLAFSPNCRVTALCDPEASHIDRAVEQFPGIQAAARFEDFPAFQGGAEVDAVLVSSRHSDHFDQVMGSFDRGWHVLCEKPLVGTLDEAAQVCAKRDEVGKIGMVGYQRHVEPEFRKIRELIQSGRYGKVQAVSAFLSQSWKRHTGGTWRHDQAVSLGGMLHDSGSHILDVMQWVTGLDVVSVSAMVDYRGADVDINSNVRLEFQGGAIGNCIIIGDAPNWQEEFTAWCDTAVLQLRQGRLSVIEEDGTHLHFEHLSSRWKSICSHFLNVIEGSEDNEAPFEVATKVIRVTRMAYASAAEGGKRLA